jgi:gas vesicle protein
MKKKIINGLLFAVAMVAATSSFVSCKDYDADNYNELQAKYASLQDAFNKQVAAMKDYVLTSRYDSETGYSASELAAKGTIKKRLDDLESEYSTLNGKFNDELDPTKVGSLAYQIAQNNIAIATAQGLAERDSIYLRTLLAGWDNGGTLGDMVTEAAGLLTALKSDTAKYNFAYDTLSTYYQKWNEAVKLANNASQFIGANVKVQGKEVTSLQDMANAYDEAVQNLQDQIDALKEDVATLKEVAKIQVTSIGIAAVTNPIFGSFSYPYGLESNILATYYGVKDFLQKFPAGDGDDVDNWVGSTPMVLTSELEAIDANRVDIPAGIVMNEKEGNAGTVYMTINPQHVDMEGKEVSLRATDNSVSKVALSPLKPCTEQLMFGNTSRRAGNAFYTAQATISKNDVEAVTFGFDMRAIAKDVQDIMQDWSSVSASDLGKVVLAVRNGLTAKVPVLFVYAPWKGVDGWTGTYSTDKLAAVSLKPIGYEFFQEIDEKGGFSPAIVKFKNQLTAKEKAIAKELYIKIAQLIANSLNLGDIAGGNVEVTADNKVYIVVSSATLPLNLTIPYGSISASPAIPDNPAGVTVTITDDNKIDITSIFTAILDKLSNVSAAAESGINTVLTKVIDIENKVFDKVIGATKAPGRFIQPALIGRSTWGYFYPSRFYNAPTLVKRGTKLQFYPTTLTAELVAPAYMKYVAVVGAWKSGNVNEDRGAKQYNEPQYSNGVLNQPFFGSDYNADKPFEFIVDAPDGTVLEFIYEAVGYNGIVAGKKYYIEVYE